MMVRRMIASQENINNAKKVLRQGLAYHNKEITKKEFSNFIHSEDCVNNVSFLGHLLTFSLIKEKSNLTIGNDFFYVSEKNEAIVLSEELKQLALAEESIFDKYLSEKGLDSLLENDKGRIKIKFNINSDIIREMGYEWDIDCFYAVEEVFKLFLAPYWLNWDTFDQADVNMESKPGMKVEELITQLMELGLNYCVNLPGYEVLFAQEMEFLMIDDFPDFKGKVQSDWELGLKILKILQNDNPVEIKSLIDSGLDRNLDFPNGNNIVSMAFKYNAVNCLDVILEKGISLWKEPSRQSEKDDLYQTVFLKMHLSNVITKFPEYQFLMGYMKKEVVSLREQGKEIKNLQHKINHIISKLKMQIRWDKRYFNQYLIDFIYDVLNESDANACFVANFYLDKDFKSEFKVALQCLGKKELKEVIAQNFNIFFLNKVVTLREVLAEDIILEGLNLRDLVKSCFDINNVLVQDTLAKIK